VVVIDIDSGNVVGKIDHTPGVHFTVIDPELDRGFVSNGGAARLTIFNTKTLETTGEVKSTGENPGPTVFDPATKRVFTFNLNSQSFVIIRAVFVDTTVGYEFESHGAHDRQADSTQGRQDTARRHVLRRRRALSARHE
jgi:DNA-binding beta-propeller fold protein YncE